MITNGKPEKDKRVAANSPKGAKSTAEKAKAARAMASGTKQINVRSFKNLGDELSSDTPRVNRNAKILAKAGKVIKVTAKQGVNGPYAEKATVKKVDLDAYDLLSKQAKAAGLKGKAAEIAISNAIKKVSTRMTNDRQRTASPGEAIVRREERKRRNTNLG
jgi:ABC-type Na+ efflux pump permease subunit